MTNGVQEIPVGLLYSRSGPYGHAGAEMVKGALLAIEEINSSDFGYRLAPVGVDPGGDPGRYEAACINMISRRGIKHIVGCYTSASRKQVLPLLSRYNALLWHPARYEGFEACENIVYVGAAPNQHVVPLARHMIRSLGRDVFCVGSNYIWTWETNRVLREIVEAAGGSILGERVIALGDIDVGHLVETIVRQRPPVVFNTLVGETSYAFFRAWDRARRQHGLDTPMLSCSLSEPELRLVGPEAATGHITSSVYFATVDREENRRFVDRYCCRFGAEHVPFSDSEASYVCVMLLGRAIRRAGRADVSSVLQAAYLDRFEAPHGPVWLDPKNNHCHLTPRIGISRADFQFDVFWESDMPVRPDPYLARLNLEGFTEAEHDGPAASREASFLRVVK